MRRQSWKQRLLLLSLTALLLWAAAPAAAQDRNDFNQKVISEFRANQGKVGGQFANRPLLLLTTTGAKSGRTITRPLAYTRDGDRLVIIASFGGGPKNPAWYHNLVAHPDEVIIQDGPEPFAAKCQAPRWETRTGSLVWSWARARAVCVPYSSATSAGPATETSGTRQGGRSAARVSAHRSWTDSSASMWHAASILIMGGAWSSTWARASENGSALRRVA